MIVAANTPVVLTVEASRSTTSETWRGGSLGSWRVCPRYTQMHAGRHGSPGSWGVALWRNSHQGRPPTGLPHRADTGTRLSESWNPRTRNDISLCGLPVAPPASTIEAIWVECAWHPRKPETSMGKVLVARSLWAAWGPGLSGELSIRTHAADGNSVPSTAASSGSAWWPWHGDTCVNMASCRRHPTEVAVKDAQVKRASWRIQRYAGRP